MLHAVTTRARTSVIRPTAMSELIVVTETGLHDGQANKPTIASAATQAKIAHAGIQALLGLRLPLQIPQSLLKVGDVPPRGMNLVVCATVDIAVVGGLPDTSGTVYELFLAFDLLDDGLNGVLVAHVAGSERRRCSERRHRAV